VRPVFRLVLLTMGCAPASPTRAVADANGGEVYAPPSVVVSGPATVRVDAVATFDASLSVDPQGLDLVAWEWACDDGSSASGAVIDVQFAAAGPVSCTVTVESETGLSATGDVTTEVRDGIAAWTFLVFVNGDNNLEEAALDDLQEMEQVGSTDDVNIVVQVDRARGYTSAEGDWQGARRYLVESDPAEGLASTLLADLGEVDSGDPQTVIDFAQAALRDFPAERVALIMWNHGWGWSFLPDDRPAATKGISQDDDSGNDISIAEGEYAAVLAAVQTELGQPLDLVGMDACLMASWEIAHTAAPYASAYVASQDYEAEDGWPYDDFLAELVLNPEMDGLLLGEAIAVAFNATRDTTQSVTDLSRLSELDAQLDAVALALLADEAGLERLRAAAGASLAFEYSGAPDRDLGQVLLALEGDDAVGLAALEARLVLEDVVTSNYTWGAAASGATGLNIYAPARGVIDQAYLDATWSQSSFWDDALQ
jgi:Clostripain family/PKD domain